MKHHEPDKTFVLSGFFDEKNKNSDLLQDQVKRLYLRFLLPSLGSAMVMSIYTLTDAIVIGQGVGADAQRDISQTASPAALIPEQKPLKRFGHALFPESDAHADAKGGDERAFTHAADVVQLSDR